MKTILNRCKSIFPIILILGIAFSPQGTGRGAPALVGLDNPARPDLDVPVTVTVSRVDAFCNPEASGQDFFAYVTIGDIGFSSEDEAGDDDNHIQPNWTFTHPGVDSATSALAITIRMRDMDGGWPLGIDPDDRVDIHPDADKNGLAITYDVASGQWTVDEGAPGPADDQPFGRDGVWRGSNGTDCAEVEFDISSVGQGDTDGDGLLDNWENLGYDADGDGVIDVDLPAMGAHPDHQDIFVEVDWMQQPVAPGAHSHEPWQAAWIPVWHAFDDSPVPNPDGTTGIHLHVDTGTLYTVGAGGLFDCDNDGASAAGDMDCDGDGVIDIGNLGALGGGTPGGGNVLAETQFLDFLGDGTANDFYVVKTNNFNANRFQVFHYTVFGHSLNAGGPNISGRAEIFGNDVLVTLGARAGAASPISGLNVRGQVNQHAGTFMHELGHNLNLRHGGGDNENYKPNYLSVMNYDHQMNGVLGLTVNSGVDYSPRALAPILAGALDENALDECIPLNDPRVGATAMWTVNAVANIRTSIASGPLSFIDWNWDNALNPGAADDGVSCGSPPNLAADINYRDTGAIQRKALSGHNDWTGGDLRLDFRHSDDFSDGAPAEMVAELDLPEEQAIAAALPAVVELSSPDQMCPTHRLISFDNLPAGTLVTNQYAGVHFIDNASVDPTTRNDAQRGAPTISPPISLYGISQPGPSSFGIPLVITFDAPQYRVGMYIGNGGSGAPPPVALRAYDAGAALIGEVSDRAPQPVTEFLGIYALEGGIRAVQLDYLTSFEEEIDNLMLDNCPTIPTGPLAPTEPFTYTVRSEYFTRQFNGAEYKVATAPLNGVSMQVNGAAHATPYGGSIARGGSLTAQAPVLADGPGGLRLAFDHWRQDGFLHYPDGSVILTDTVQTNATYIAVYKLPANQYLPHVSR